MGGDEGEPTMSAFLSFWRRAVRRLLHSLVRLLYPSVTAHPFFISPTPPSAFRPHTQELTYHNFSARAGFFFRCRRAAERGTEWARAAALARGDLDDPHWRALLLLPMRHALQLVQEIGASLPREIRRWKKVRALIGVFILFLFLFAPLGFSSFLFVSLLLPPLSHLRTQVPRHQDTLPQFSFLYSTSSLFLIISCFLNRERLPMGRAPTSLLLLLLQSPTLQQNKLVVTLGSISTTEWTA